MTDTTQHYTYEDFRNAEFAKHPDGRIAARADPDDPEQWSVSTMGKGPWWNTDAEMASEGFIPVSAEAKVEALREAEDEFRHCKDYPYRATRMRATEDYLNDRADRIEKENER